MQGWAAKTGPELQSILRNQKYSWKKGGHLDKDEHKMLGLGEDSYTTTGWRRTGERVEFFGEEHEEEPFLSP